MKNKITVFKAFVSRKKEESYLNEMNKRGWKLSMLRFGFYTFIKTEPNEFMTVLHFAERQYQTTFLRTVTECGCEVALQENSGKYILFYINAPVGSENIDFLTDNKSKLDFNKRLSLQYKREFIPLFAVIPFTFLPVLMSIPITAMIFRTAPEDPHSLMKDYLFGYIGNAVLILCRLICATMGVYILVLYSKTKREIKRISNEMKIFE